VLERFPGAEVVEVRRAGAEPPDPSVSTPIEETDDED
jgi:hypothetical protein